LIAIFPFESFVAGTLTFPIDEHSIAEVTVICAFFWELTVLSKVAETSTVAPALS